MSILTIRELEFLASLRTSWSRLYWNELADLLKQDRGQRVGWRQASTMVSAPRQATSLTVGSNSSMFGPEDRDRTA